MDNKLPVTSKYLNMLRKSAPKEATPDDLNELYYLAKQYDLDPIKKEIFLLKFKNKYGGFNTSIITSRDGYLKVANRNPEFNGMEADAIYEGDILRRREDGSISIEYGENHFKFDRSMLKGAFCNVYRKDRDKAASMVVSMRDYDKGRDMWLVYPDAMIIKVAEAMALKRAFALTGLVTQEEMGVNEPPKNNVVDASIEIQVKDEEENED